MRPSCPVCRCWMRDRAVHPMQNPDGSWVTFPMEPHCSPCWLFGWSSREVRVYNDIREMGISISETEAAAWRVASPAAVATCNSTDYTAATSHFGGWPRRVGFDDRPDDWRLTRWLQVFTL